MAFLSNIYVNRNDCLCEVALLHLLIKSLISLILNKNSHLTNWKHFLGADFSWLYLWIGTSYSIIRVLHLTVSTYLDIDILIHFWSNRDIC